MMSDDEPELSETPHADVPSHEIQWTEIETPRGVWLIGVKPGYHRYREYRTHQTLFGLPLVHMTFGLHPETRKSKTAKGIIAIGRFAQGGLAIGQVSVGVVAIGQASMGMIFGLGQATFGFVAIGQLAVSGLFAFGQLVFGYVTIGQIGFGHYVMAQIGFGDFVWDTWKKDPLARQIFKSLLNL